MPDGQCDPACIKIIIDTGGRLAAAGHLFADHGCGLSAGAAAAGRYLARIAEADARALVTAIKSGHVTKEKLDEAHAWSELNCHRAAEIESWCVGSAMTRGESLERATLLFGWAGEDRIFTTRLAGGGEYSGPWIIDGTKGISFPAKAPKK